MCVHSCVCLQGTRVVSSCCLNALRSTSLLAAHSRHCTVPCEWSSLHSLITSPAEGYVFVRIGRYIPVGIHRYVCEQLPGASSSLIVTNLGQSYPWPQGTGWLNLGTPRGAGVLPFRLCSSLVHSLPHLLLFITVSLFYFSHSLYLFSYIVHPIPFYQNRLTPFPGRRS